VLARAQIEDKPAVLRSPSVLTAVPSRSASRERLESRPEVAPRAVALDSESPRPNVGPVLPPPRMASPVASPTGVMPGRHAELGPRSRVLPPQAPELIIDHVDIRVVTEAAAPTHRAPSPPAKSRSGAWNTAARYYLARLS
jgi:hypothetical protein